MLIQINTDNHTAGDQALVDRTSETIRSALTHFSERITRVEAHISDEDGEKGSGPAEMRCLLEARIAGRQPLAVSDTSTTIDLAVSGAAGKLHRMLESTFGRLETH